MRALTSHLLPLVLLSGCARHDQIGVLESIGDSPALITWKSVQSQVLLTDRVEALGQPYSNQIQVLNGFESELTITEVWKDCSCAEASVTETVLRPGDVTTLVLTAHIDRLRQEFKVRIYGKVANNDRKEPVLSLVFTINAAPNAVLCVPQVIELSEGGGPGSATVHIISSNYDFIAPQFVHPENLVVEPSPPFKHGVLDGVATSALTLSVQLIDYENPVEWITVRDPRSGAQGVLRVACSSSRDTSAPDYEQKIFAGLLEADAFPISLNNIGIVIQDSETAELLESSIKGLGIADGMIQWHGPEPISDLPAFELRIRVSDTSGQARNYSVVGRIRV